MRRRFLAVGLVDLSKAECMTRDPALVDVF